jgi:hypothetical protein
MNDVPSEPAMETLNESTLQIKMPVKSLSIRHGAINPQGRRRIKNKRDYHSQQVRRLAKRILDYGHEFPEETAHRAFDQEATRHFSR